MSNKRVLLLRIEPTGYTLALLRALRELWSGEIEAHFVSAHATQSWSFDEQEVGAGVLPSGVSDAKRAIRKVIEESPPSLVHVAGWGAPACRAAISSANSLRLPVVVDSDTWQDAATGIRLIAKRVTLPIRLRKITHFAPAGRRQAAFLQRYGVPASRMTPINMSVDVSSIREHLLKNPKAGTSFRGRHGLSEACRVVLFMARLVPEKGIIDLVEAWRVLAPKEPNTHLVIAGDGPMRTELDSLTYERMLIVGRLSGEDVWNAYAAANVFVAPSRWEPWGLTVNEAMAVGVPIIMTDVFGCIGDIALSNETACIVPAADANRLREALEKMLSDDDYRNHLSHNAYKLISSWTIEDEAKRIVDIWGKLLKLE